MRRILARTALLALCTFIVSACATFGERAATPEERTAFDAARARAMEDPRAGTQALEAFLAQFPEGPLVDDAHYEIARISHRAGRIDTFLAKCGNRRRDDSRFLASHPAILSGMRVEAAQRQARAFDTEVALQRFGDNAALVADQID